MSVLEKTPESELDSTSAISTDAVSDVYSVQDASSDMFVSGSDTELDDMCICSRDGRAHKRDCPMSFRKRYCEHAPPNTLHNTAVASACGEELELASAAKITLHAPPSKMRKLPMKVEDYVCVHSSTMAISYVPCHIVEIGDSRYQLYCAKGVLSTSLSCTELTPLTSCASLPVDTWWQSHCAVLPVTQQLLSTLNVLLHCVQTIVISSGAEEEAMALWTD